MQYAIVPVASLLIGSMAFFSCKDSGTEPVIQDLKSISGKIENWTMGDTMVVRANYHYLNYHLQAFLSANAGESGIDKNGYFSIPVGILPDSALAEYGWIFGGVLVSDTIRASASV